MCVTLCLASCRTTRVQKRVACLVAGLGVAVATQRLIAELETECYAREELLEACKRSQRTIQQLQSCDGSSARRGSPCAQVIGAV